MGTLKTIAITGFIGATFNGGRGGFCTNDGNKIQGKLTYKYTWDALDGWDCGSWEGQIWMAFAFGSYFQFQATIPFSHMESWAGLGGTDDNPWTFKLYFALANGFVNSDKMDQAQVLAQTIGNSVLSIFSTMYNKFKQIQNVSIKNIKDKLADGIRTIMSAQTYEPIKRACAKSTVLEKTKTDETGSMWASFGAAAGAQAVKAAVQQYIKNLSPASYGKLTEAGASLTISKAGINVVLELADTTWLKLDLTSVVLYAITGNSYELKLGVKSFAEVDQMAKAAGYVGAAAGN